MNRILFEKSEIKDGVATFGGIRAEHVLNVLHGEVGQTLKTGEIDGPIGIGEIVAIKGEAASSPLFKGRNFSGIEFSSRYFAPCPTFAITSASGHSASPRSRRVWFTVAARSAFVSKSVPSKSKKTAFMRREV